MKLTIVNGPDQGADFVLPDDAEVTIGRIDECDVSLHDSESSRHHARIRPHKMGCLLEDMQSTNGTFLNGALIQRAQLSEDDLIVIGETTLQISDIHTVKDTDLTGVRFGADQSEVLLALDHTQADLLAGEAPPRSLEELERENRLLRDLCEVSRILTSGGDPQDLLDTALKHVCTMLDADTASVLVRVGDDEWQVRAGSLADGGPGEITVSRTIIQQALHEHRAILSGNTLSDERFDPSQSIVAQRITSALCCPMYVRDEPEGVLFVDRRTRAASFVQTDLRLAASAAHVLALFLEKEKYETESREKARLAVIGEVVAGLAHYAKNILTALRFALASMKRQVADRNFDSIDRSMNSISTSERQISDLVLDMLSYAKDRRPVRGAVQLGDLIARVVEPYEPILAERKILFEVVSEDALPPVHAEDRSLERVFLNLLINAMDAVASATEKKITASLSRRNGQVEVLFADTGCGIPEDKVADVFRVFFSTKGSKGTGLGLAVVQKIIEEHGGAIEVASVPDKGTEFRLTLPVMLEAAPPTTV